MKTDRFFRVNLVQPAKGGPVTSINLFYNNVDKEIDLEDKQGNALSIPYDLIPELSLILHGISNEINEKK